MHLTMATKVKVIGGSVPAQTAVYDRHTLCFLNDNNDKFKYWLPSAIENVEKIADDKRSMTFKVTVAGHELIIDGNLKLFNCFISDQSKDGGGKSPLISHKAGGGKISPWLWAVLVIGIIIAIAPKDDKPKPVPASQQTRATLPQNSIPSQPTSLAPELNYVVLSEGVSNQAGELSIDQRLQVNSKATREELEEWLTSIWSNLKSNGYQKIHLYAYPPEEINTSKLNWAGMLSWREVTGAPKLTFKDEQITLLQNISTPAQEIANTGNWATRSEVSPIDDSTNVTIGMEAWESFRNDYGQMITPVLLIRCKENTTDVIVQWGTYLGIDETAVIMRLGKDKAKERSWTISTNYEAVFAPSPINLTKEMMKHNSILLNVTPHGSNPVTAEFDLIGLQDAVKPLKEACGW